MEIKLIRDPIRKADLAAMAKEQFGDMIKAVVDVSQGNLAVGGELHADEEALLMENGSRQDDLWGINLYPANAVEDWIEFDSMINIRPSRGNRSRDVEDPAIRKKIAQIVKKWVMDA